MRSRRTDAAVESNWRTASDMAIRERTAWLRRVAFRHARRRLRALALGAALVALAAPRAIGVELPEYRIKAGFLYNFAVFTDWPAEVGPTIHFCIFGTDPFGAELDPFREKRIGERAIAIRQESKAESLRGCQVVFFSSATVASLPRVLELLRGSPVLTVADTPGATERGVALNMSVVDNKVAFTANLPAARSAGVTISSKVLRLAREVRK